MENIVLNQLVSAQNIGQHKIVSVNTDNKLVIADPTISELGNSIAGITLASVVIDGTVNVIREGTLIYALWNWTPNVPLFLGLGGIIQETPIIDSFSIQIGFSIDPTTIYVDIDQPIFF